MDHTNLPGRAAVKISYRDLQRSQPSKWAETKEALYWVAALVLMVVMVTMPLWATPYGT